MKVKFKHLILKGILVCTFLSQGVGIQATTAPIQIKLNQQLQWGTNPIVEKNTTLVPLRGIGNLLGASVDWDPSTKTITIVQGNVINTLKLNETTAYKEDGNAKTKIQLTLPPQSKNGTTYVPLRYIAESLDIKVNWNPETKIVEMNECFQYKNQTIFLGDSTSDAIDIFGKPSYTMIDEAYEYLFYTDDYENVLVLFSANDLIVGFTTSAETMKFRDIVYKSTNAPYITSLSIIVDKHDDNKIVGLGCNIESTNSPTQASLFANERIIFELTNGFRTHNNIAPLTYNSKLSHVARQHSKDMADHNYFSHTSLDGTSLGERITRGGIDWISCGENIAAGNLAGLLVFDQWLNSLGHRENMLERSGDLGVGSHYNANSPYMYYHTQNFAHIR